MSQEKIKELLFKQVEKPKGLCETKIINVYENRYRINLWVKIEEDGFTKNKIGKSFFATFENDELHIKQGNEK